MANKRKTTTAIVAGVTAAALLLGGTFAWVSISQQAKNEAAGIVNVGGRLHDDFNGTNKDVYVENFTDPYNGGQPIYARVKLTEYMEVGQDAGGFGTDTNGDGKITAVPVVSGTDINDKDNWPVHVPTELCTTCNTGETCLIHDHWTWTMGGDEGSTGSTIFMPTFNKDKDSLDADINGTYAGTNPNDKIYYDDYVTYVTENGTVVDLTADFTKPEGAETANALTEANTDVTSVTGTAYYDDDTNTNENDHENEIGVKVETETHTAKETAGATVITMNEWLTTYNSQPGNYWVYDEDGWAYWANPIMPGEATGLLLDGIEMTKNPGEKCYYAINVVGQFATVGDWEYFDGFNETDNANALAVLKAASANVPNVTVNNQDKVTLVKRGDEVNFSASTTVGTVSTLADNDEYEWIVLDEDLKKSETSTIKDNGDGTATLKVGDEELSAGLYVAARAKNHGGAVGLSAVAVQIYNVTITEQNNTTVIKAGNTLRFSASVVDGSTGDAEKSGVTWTVTGGSEANTTITTDGVLTIDENEQGATVLTVTATSVNGSFVQTYTVTVADKYTVTVSQADNAAAIFPGDELQFSAAMTKNGETVPPDIEWTVSGGSGTTAIDQNGLLTVDENEKGAATLTVKATCKADETISGTYTVRVDRYEITLSGGASTVTPGTSWQFNAAVTLNGETISSDVTWKVTDAAGAQVSGVTVDETGKLSVAETVAVGTELTVTASADDVGDPVSVSRQLTVKIAELVMRLYYNNNFNTVRETVENGQNRSSMFGDGWTYQIRIYDTDGNWIKGDQAELTIWIDGTDVTGGGKDCTNGYDSTNGHWWAWIGASNDGTEVTFKITYGVSTFEATIW